MASSKWQKSYNRGLSGGGPDGINWEEQDGWSAGFDERRRRESEREESKKNEERRHRELLDAVESRDDGEDYREEDRPPVEPLIYSEKTRRVSGMDRLKNIITRTENENFSWSSYENSDSDCGYEGSAPDGKYRIHICVESPYLDFAIRVSRIMELEDFNVLSSYHPLSEEEKNLVDQLAKQINILIRVENLYQNYNKGIERYGDAMSCFNRGNKSIALAVFGQARAIFYRICCDANTLIAGLSGMSGDCVTATNNIRNAAYYACLAIDNLFINWESNYFDYVNYCSKLMDYHSALVYNFLHPKSQ